MASYATKVQAAILKVYLGRIQCYSYIYDNYVKCRKTTKMSVKVIFWAHLERNHLLHLLSFHNFTSNKV